MLHQVPVFSATASFEEQTVLWRQSCRRGI